MSSLEVDSEALERTLWQCWMNHRDAATRTRLFFLYTPWSRLMARKLMARYAHPLAEWHDYASLSAIGLLLAIDRFDATVTTRFQTFAEKYVKGSVLKGLSCFARDCQRVSRDRLDSFSGDGRYDDRDLEQSVNAAVGLAFGCFLELGINNADAVSGDPLGIYQQDLRDHTLIEIIRRLPEREQHVIIGHYYQHHSFMELSHLLGVSKSRISQLHGQALKRARKMHEALERPAHASAPHPSGLEAKRLVQSFRGNGVDPT